MRLITLVKPKFWAMLWITLLRQVKIDRLRQAKLNLPDIKAEAISVRVITTVFDYQHPHCPVPNGCFEMANRQPVALQNLIGIVSILQR